MKVPFLFAMKTLLERHLMAFKPLDKMWPHRIVIMGQRLPEPFSDRFPSRHTEEGRKAFITEGHSLINSDMHDQRRNGVEKPPEPAGTDLFNEALLFGESFSYKRD